MHKHQSINFQIDQQKLDHYLQKATQTLLNVFNYLKITPFMIQIHNIVDYAKNLDLMMQQLYKSLSKKVVSVQVFKKLESQLMEKSEKITKLLESEKNLKIETKVLEDKLKESQTKLKQVEFQKQFNLPESFKKIINEKQSQISERLSLQRNFIEMKKKRMSLPRLPASSTEYPSPQKIVRSSKQKKSLFVNIPGEGNEILIKHLMNKVSSK